MLCCYAAVFKRITPAFGQRVYCNVEGFFIGFIGFEELTSWSVDYRLHICILRNLDGCSCYLFDYDFTVARPRRDVGTEVAIRNDEAMIKITDLRKVMVIQMF